MKLCQHCQQQFQPAKFHANQKYCSGKCSANAQYASKTIKSLKECAHCQVEFASSDRRKIYCSKRCKVDEGIKQLTLKNRQASPSGRRRAMKGEATLPHNEQVKRWKKNNKDKVMAYNYARKTKTPMNLVPQEELDSILYEYNGMCAYCSISPFEHWDHFEPIAKGGLHTSSNLVPSCAKCNLSKGAKLFMIEWAGRNHG